MPALNVQNGAYLVALLISVAMALVVIVALNQPLRRYLLRVCESAERAEFLTRWFQVLVVLLPALAITLSIGFAGSAVDDAIFARVLFHCGWSGSGLVVAVLCVGFCAAGSPRGRGRRSPEPEAPSEAAACRDVGTLRVPLDDAAASSGSRCASRGPSSQGTLFWRVGLWGKPLSLPECLSKLGGLLHNSCLARSFPWSRRPTAVTVRLALRAQGAAGPTKPRRDASRS